LRRIGATLPVYVKEWRTLPITEVATFVSDAIICSDLPDAVTPSESQDCEVVNTLVDTWRERGAEIVPEMMGKPLAWCAAHTQTRCSLNEN
jgi:hypothetical protein